MLSRCNYKTLKMEYKSIVSISFVTFVLLLVFYRTFWDDFFAENIGHCNDDEICVRFCCFDAECEDNSHFRIDHLEQAENLTANFKILKKISCTQLIDEEAEWWFLKVN
jgi:hypothetical protein